MRKRSGNESDLWHQPQFFGAEMTSYYLWGAPKSPWVGFDWKRVDINQADPYLVWADARGALPADLDRISVLVELTTTQTIHKLRKLAGSSPKDIAEVSSLYPGSKGSGVSIRYCTMQVRPSFFSDPAKSGVVRYAIGWPRIPIANEKALGENIQWIDNSPVIAVIDDGLPFLNEAFRYWDAASKERSRVMWFKSLDKNFKVELSRTKIEKYLTTSEEKTYKSLGYARVAADASHGAHVMDTAAGKNGSGFARELPVIAVQLPTRTVVDSSGGSLAVHAADALRYVLNQVPPNRPVVACMSYGIHAGPHDGSSLLECAMDEMLTQRQNAAVVIPAGNNYLARGHARVELIPGTTQTLIWRIHPDGLTDSFCEIWFDEFTEDGAKSPSFELALTPPFAKEQTYSKPGVFALYKKKSPNVPIASIVVQKLQRDGRVRWSVLMSVASTVGADAAPHGMWEIKIKNCLVKKPLALNAWIERNGPVFGGNSGGLQSYFEDTPASAVTGEGTLNGIATGSETFVVGAYVEATDEMSSYSASGASYFTGRTTQPLCSAVGDVDADGRGVQGAGTLSGTHCWLSGTSVAAAHATRKIADIWALNPTMDRSAVKALLVKNFPPNISADFRQGAGKLPR
jgi:Subtilase family